MVSQKWNKNKFKPIGCNGPRIGANLKRYSRQNTFYIFCETTETQKNYFNFNFAKLHLVYFIQN